MRGPHTPTHPEPRRGRYEIRVRGHLDDRWAAWFEGLAMARLDDGTTVLTGVATDQSALHGWLRRIRDLGVELVSVVPLEPGDATEPPA